MTTTTDSSVDRGLAPVVGTALLIAVTVLLAAVVGAMGLGLSSEALHNTPQASLSVATDAGSDRILITHDAGDGLDAASTRLVISVAGTEATFEDTGSSAVLSVGSIAVVVTTGNDVVDWDGDGTNETYTPRGGDDVLPPLASGDEVSVRLVDVNSQTVYFETSVTV